MHVQARGEFAFVYIHQHGMFPCNTNTNVIRCAIAERHYRPVQSDLACDAIVVCTECNDVVVAETTDE